jgi:hypothetical protein
MRQVAIEERSHGMEPFQALDLAQSAYLPKTALLSGNARVLQGASNA